jgi:hypothetical protein
MKQAKEAGTKSPIGKMPDNEPSCAVEAHRPATSQSSFPAVEKRTKEAEMADAKASFTAAKRPATAQSLAAAVEMSHQAQTSATAEYNAALETAPPRETDRLLSPNTTAATDGLDFLGLILEPCPHTTAATCGGLDFLGLIFKSGDHPGAEKTFQSRFPGPTAEQRMHQESSHPGGGELRMPQIASHPGGGELSIPQEPSHPGGGELHTPQASSHSGGGKLRMPQESSHPGGGELRTPQASSHSRGGEPPEYPSHSTPQGGGPEGPTEADRHAEAAWEAQGFVPVIRRSGRRKAKLGASQAQCGVHGGSYPQPPAPLLKNSNGKPGAEQLPPRASAMPPEYAGGMGAAHLLRGSGRTVAAAEPAGNGASHVPPLQWSYRQYSRIPAEVEELICCPISQVQLLVGLPLLPIMTHGRKDVDNWCCDVIVTSHDWRSV